MDVTIGKLEQILRLKEQEARIADSELMQNVYKNRGEYFNFEGKLGSQKKEYEGNLSESQKYTDAYSALMGLKGEMNKYITGNKLRASQG